MKCECCDSELRFQWSDTHGVGVCINCGLPYRIIHYEKQEDGKEARVDKDPEIAVTPQGVEIAKRYYAEEKGRVFPGCYDMGIGHNGRSYSGATREDYEQFDKWYSAHRSEFEPAAAHD